MPTIDEMRGALTHEESAIRTRAARELGKRGAEAEPAVDDLVALFTDPDPMARAMAASALGRIGGRARTHAEALAQLLDDPVIPVRFWAAEALGDLGVDTPTVRAGLEALTALDLPLAKAARHAAKRALRRLDRAGEA